MAYRVRSCATVTSLVHYSGLSNPHSITIIIIIIIMVLSSSTPNNYQSDNTGRDVPLLRRDGVGWGGG
jgi:hypothetical protein